MENKNTTFANALRYVCAALWLVPMCSSCMSFMALIDYFSPFDDIQYAMLYAIQALAVICDLMMVAACLTKQRSFAQIGSIMIIVATILSFLNACMNGFRFYSIVTIIALLAVRVLLLMTVVSKNEKSKTMGYATAGAYLIYAVVGGLFLSAASVISIIVNVGAFALLGMVLSEIPVSVKTAAPVPTPTAGNSSDTISRLTKLKELLDKGIISQEEFDEKKQQILMK